MRAEEQAEAQGALHEGVRAAFVLHRVSFRHERDRARVHPERAEFAQQIGRGPRDPERPERGPARANARSER